MNSSRTNAERRFLQQYMETYGSNEWMQAESESIAKNARQMNHPLKSVRNLNLANIPYGAVMPVMNREDEVTYMDVPFGEQVYLQENLNSAGRPRRVYALQTVKGLRQTNPFTRRPFAAGNIKRVKRNNR